MITEEEGKKLNEERMARCVPAAKAIIALLASKDVHLGKLTDEDKPFYNELGIQVIQILLDNKIHFTDRHLVFQLALQAIEQTRDVVISSLEMSFEKANEKLWGKDLYDIELQDIDDKMKKVGLA